MSAARLTRTPVAARLAALPLRLGAEPVATTMRVARMTNEEQWARVQDSFRGTAVDGSRERLSMANDGITEKDMVPVYFSLNPYHHAFEERLDMRWYGAYNKPAGGMVFAITDDRLTLRDMLPSLPTAKIPAWWTRIHGAWLHKV